MKIEFKSVEEIKKFVKGSKVFIFSCDDCGFNNFEEKNSKILEYVKILGYELVGIYTQVKKNVM